MWACGRWGGGWVGHRGKLEERIRNVELLKLLLIWRLVSVGLRLFASRVYSRTNSATLNQLYIGYVSKLYVSLFQLLAIRDAWLILGRPMLCLSGLGFFCCHPRSPALQIVQSHALVDVRAEASRSSQRNTSRRVVCHSELPLLFSTPVALRQNVLVNTIVLCPFCCTLQLSVVGSQLSRAIFQFFPTGEPPVMPLSAHAASMLLCTGEYGLSGY